MSEIRRAPKLKIKQRKDIMLCYDYSERRLLSKYGRPWYIQPKLEGDRCRAVRDPSLGWLLFSSTATMVRSVPHINQYLNDHREYDTYAELDGELYIHGRRHEEIRSIVSRTIGLHPESGAMELHVFDIIDDDPRPFRYRAGRLLALPINGPIKAVSTFTTDTLTGDLSLEYFYDKFVRAGYEGIIIRDAEGLYKRSRSTQIMKLKPREELTCYVSGLIEEHDTNTGVAKSCLGAIECLHPDVGSAFKVGTGFTDRQRVDFWQQPDLILNKFVEITYQSFTANSVKMSAFKRVVDDYSYE